MTKRTITKLTDENKALAILARLRLKGSPCKQWRSTVYFNVPGVVMQKLAREGKCETRKLSCSSPTEYQP
jgi:hypothetical protein